MLKLLSNWVNRFSDKEVRRYRVRVDMINRLEPQFQGLTDEELRNKTDEFRQRLADGTSLNDLLPEALR